MEECDRSGKFRESGRVFMYVCICTLGYITYEQWNLSIKVTLNEGHLYNEDSVCSPNHIELCTNLPLS